MFFAFLIFYGIADLESPYVSYLLENSKGWLCRLSL